MSIFRWLLYRELKDSGVPMPKEEMIETIRLFIDNLEKSKPAPRFNAEYLSNDDEVTP